MSQIVKVRVTDKVSFFPFFHFENVVLVDGARVTNLATLSIDLASFIKPFSSFIFKKSIGKKNLATLEQMLEMVRHSIRALHLTHFAAAGYMSWDSLSVCQVWAHHFPQWLVTNHHYYQWLMTDYHHYQWPVTDHHCSKWSNWSPLFPMTSNWLPLFPMTSYWSPSLPVHSNWEPLFPMASNWSQSFITTSNWSPLFWMTSTWLPLLLTANYFCSEWPITNVTNEQWLIIIFPMTSN